MTTNAAVREQLIAKVILGQRIFEAQGHGTTAELPGAEHVGRVAAVTKQYAGDTLTGSRLLQLVNDVLDPFAIGVPEDRPMVLVLDDDPRERLWLVEVLTGGGYRVREAGTGEEALHLCRERKFDAMVLDLLLPDMAGAEVLKHIRADTPNADTPVVVVMVLGVSRVMVGLRSEADDSRVVIWTGATVDQMKGEPLAHPAQAVVSRSRGERVLLKELSLLLGHRPAVTLN